MSSANQPEVRLVADPEIAYRDEPIILMVTVPSGITISGKIEWTIKEPTGTVTKADKLVMDPYVLDTTHLIAGTYTIEAKFVLNQPPTGQTTQAAPPPPVTLSKKVIVKRGANVGRVADEGLKVIAEKRSPTLDQSFWVALRQCVDHRTFTEYSDFIDCVLCDDPRNPRLDKCKGASYPEIRKIEPLCLYTHGIHGYELLKAATEVYLLCHACCGDTQIDAQQFGKEVKEERDRLDYAANVAELKSDLETYLSSKVSPRTIPYLERIIDRLLKGIGSKFPDPNIFPFCSDSLRNRPCLFELIWSYWQEEGMLVQTINSISVRFQNRQVLADGRHPLANFALDPLRPLNNLLWGYLQDEDRRLTVQRRAYEYDHEYGLKLVGKAVGTLQSAEPRSKFLEAFHNLLRQCSLFYLEDSNQWITPDTFPLLNAIRTVHLLLAEGAHNQFGDLPSTARMEMLIQQWLLAQPPMREFLQSRTMVPYEEAWMGQVDAMKKLMGWSDVSIIHFHKLAVYGEKILLSLRYGDWNDLGTLADQAGNWALYFRPEIQGYIEAYRTVTAADLSATVRTIQRVDATLPGVLLQDRLRQQRTAAK